MGTQLSQLQEILKSCVLCPRLCKVSRTEEELGYCGIGIKPVVSSASPHFGEEPPLVGTRGSGTIFFAGCNLGCVFCQNFMISHLREGCSMTVTELADTMLRLESSGCHNINWVTPTHQIPSIIAALVIARKKGLRLPTAYNCGGYERVETLRLLEGFVDIYMPDTKYFSTITAKQYSGAPDYPQIMKAALKEMHRQVGDLEIRDGLAVRGMLIRHLTMPGCTSESLAILDFIADEISRNSYVNVMRQYRPTYRAHEYPEIDRPINNDEYHRVRSRALEHGFRLERFNQ